MRSLSGCCQVVYAVGFERHNSFELLVDGRVACPTSLENYDKETGEVTRLQLATDAEELKTENRRDEFLTIRSGSCFGLGIAFPAHYTDDEGTTEPWVGFHRNIEQMGRIVRDFQFTKQ